MTQRTPDQAATAGWRSLVVMVGLAVLASAWLGRGADAAQVQQLRQHARPGDIHLISSIDCTHCTRARHWLNQHAIPFEECFVERDAQCQATYQRLGAQGTPTVLVRGRVQRGFSAAAVAQALKASGA